MTTTPLILALDLAQQAGWALGRVGEDPRSGSIRFARDGHSAAAHFRSCREWITGFVAINKPDIIVFEGPMAPTWMEGKTTTETVFVLMGLIAIVEEALYDSGVRVRQASVSKVREFFLGSSRIKRADAKRETKKRCVLLGWPVVDDNAADACATWLYMCSLIDPTVAVRHTPLFGKTGGW